MWSKTGLVLEETPESAWCNVRLKSEFYESRKFGVLNPADACKNNY
jgi:hypothetical protein